MPPDALAPTSVSLCPLCGQANRCAMQVQHETGVAQGPCWCTRVDFPADLLERVPAAAQGIACICETCARSRPAA